MGITKIEWCHYSANLWWGCTMCSPGCDNCYAETLSHRWGNDIWGFDKPRKEIKSVWNDFIKYQKLANAAGEMHRVFVGSMMDIFEKPMPLIDSKGNPAIDASDGSPITNEYIRERYFEEVVPATPNLMHLMLTKRPSNINKYIPESWKNNSPKNIMYGTSPVNQETFDNLWLHLARIKGKRFLSIEPMIGKVILKSYCPSCDRLLNGSLSPVCGTCHTKTIKPDWVICGGESGNEARPMHPGWARELRDQCINYNIPFFFKQNGEWQDGSNVVDKKYKGRHGVILLNGDFAEWDLKSDGPFKSEIKMQKKYTPEEYRKLRPATISFVGKKAAGRMLDDKFYNQTPDVYDKDSTNMVPATV